MTDKANAQDKSAGGLKIVRKHMLGAMAAGVLPIPLLDLGILGAVHLRMVSKLAAHYEVDFIEHRANAIIAALAGISMARTALSLLRMIPGFSQVMLGVSALAFGPASTYALGVVFIKHFESGGTFLTFDESKAKKDFEEELEVGKRINAEPIYIGVKP